MINEVNAGSTAEKAGLQAGDVVTKVDDARITGADSLVATIRSYRPGDTVTLTWLRTARSSPRELVLDSDGARHGEAASSAPRPTARRARSPSPR